MEMREIGRSSWNDTHNVTSLIVFLKYVSDILQTEEAFTVGEYKHTHTYTHTENMKTLVLEYAFKRKSD